MSRLSGFGKLAVAAAMMLSMGSPAAWCQAKDADREKAIQVLVLQGQLEGAVEACRAWIKEDPQATKPHLMLGEVYAGMSLWDKAQQEFRTVLDLNPAAAIAHARLGDVLYLQGKGDEAKQEYTEALRMNDKCLEAYFGLLRLAVQEGKAEEARGYLDMAMQIAPDDPSVRAFAGELQRAAGKLPEAEATLKSALTRDPNHRDALWSLAACVQMQGRETEAEALWDRFLALESGTERAWIAKNGLVELTRRRLGGPPGTNERPVFSPDGKTLAFGGHSKPADSREGDYEIWTMPADGSRPAECLTTGGGAMYPNWTLDGKSILFEFMFGSDYGRRKAYVVPLAGGEPRCLSAGLGYSVEPIPGTDRVLYSGGSRLLSVSQDGTDPQILPARPPASYYTYEVSASPDGTSVVFAATKSAKRAQPECQLFVAPLDGSRPPRQITHDDASERFGSLYPCWGPDGQRILFANDISHPHEGIDIFVTVLGDPHPPYRLAEGTEATWSPDGASIAFRARIQNSLGVIFVMELGGERLPIMKPKQKTEPRKP